MDFITYIAVFLVLAAPSLQQGTYGGRGGGHDGGHGGRGGHGDHRHGGSGNQGSCYDRCYSAYQTNSNNYFVTGCVCTQYNFATGGGSGNHGNHGQNVPCGVFEVTCRASPGEYDTVYAYTYDSYLKSCSKVSVYNRCAGTYGGSSNIFQSQQDCAKACEYNNRGY